MATDSDSTPGPGSLAALPVERTPSAIEFPGAFTTQPTQLDKTQLASVERVSLMPRAMKNRVTEAMGGGLANVVGGMLGMVGYGSARAAGDLPQTPDSLSAAPLALQVPSAGTSVAADLDEHCLADANADNPESTRPATPTKTRFGRILRFPSADVAPYAGDADKDADADRVDGGPVARNVAQRTGVQFRAGAEERRRYMRRVSKAPQLDTSGARRRSASAGGDAAEASASDSSSDATDDCTDAAPDASAPRAVDAWRFIAPRSKRVKRRALWRLFLAQEITPQIYDEAGERRASAAKAAVWALEFSVCGRYLAAGGQDGVVRVWRLRAYAREQQQQLLQQAAAPAQLSPDSVRAVDNAAPVARIAKHARTFSLGQAARAEPTGQLESPDPHPMLPYELLEPVPFRSYVGHTADVLALSWSKNGFLLSASADRTVRLWHPHRPECLCTFRHRDVVTSVAFSPRDDRLFVSGSLDCRLRLWDIPARGVRHWTRLPDAQMVTAVAFTGARGDGVVAGTYRGMCVFYSTDGLALQGRMHARSSRGRNAQGSKITGFATHSAADRLLVSSNDSRLRMFLPAARQLERKYKGHANASSQAYARLSADARYAVSGSEDHNVYVWPIAQDNAASPATHPNADHIRRAAPARARAPLLQALLGRPKTVTSPASPASHVTAPASVAADPAAEWESLDSWVEEKSIYEYFPAHDAAVSQALFAPAATLQYLADHGDPILSRAKLRAIGPTGEVENRQSPTVHAAFCDDGLSVPGPSGGAVEDMTAIIVSADIAGNIRVFRKDINAPARVRRTPSAAAPSPDLRAYSMASAPAPRRSTLDLPRPLSSASRSTALTECAPVPPRPATQRQSFWGRLGRRMTASRNSSAASAVYAPPQPLPPPPLPLPEQSSSSVCHFCGHHRMIEFAVAPTVDSALLLSPPSLSVCENCRRVKNMPGAS
ncbi:hypothetical protein GGI04_001806 [Coemansia thaxteri]|nr:hypothetical protein GGI04_001806 [Coemansia thaxteri]